MEKLPDYIANNIRKLIGYFSSLEDLCEHENNLILWSGCNGMSDVAYAMVEEGCIEVPELHLQYHIHQHLSAQVFFARINPRSGPPCFLEPPTRGGVAIRVHRRIERSQPFLTVTITILGRSYGTPKLDAFNSLMWVSYLNS